MVGRIRCPNYSLAIVMAETLVAEAIHVLILTIKIIEASKLDLDSARLQWGKRSRDGT